MLVSMEDTETTFLAALAGQSRPVCDNTLVWALSGDQVAREARKRELEHLAARQRKQGRKLAKRSRRGR